MQTGMIFNVRGLRRDAAEFVDGQTGVECIFKNTSALLQDVFDLLAWSPLASNDLR
jgi:hypothetical protein